MSTGATTPRAGAVQRPRRTAVGPLPGNSELGQVSRRKDEPLPGGRADHCLSVGGLLLPPPRPLLRRQRSGRRTVRSGVVQDVLEVPVRFR